MTVIIGSIERGRYVLRAPEYGQTVSVALRPIGERIGGVEIGAAVARMGDPIISGKIWNKLKKGAKKAVSKTISVAKKVASNKLTKKLYSVAKSVTPAPFSLAFTAAEAGAKLVKAVKGGNPKAKPAAEVAKNLATKKITVQQASAQAKKIGVKPETVKAAALLPRLKALAPKNPELAKALTQAGEISKVVDAPKMIVQAASGRKYEVSVRPA